MDVFGFGKWKGFIELLINCNKDFIFFYKFSFIDKRLNKSGFWEWIYNCDNFYNVIIKLLYVY